MNLIIDIPESILNTIQADEMISREQLAVLQIHILNGTPLPKGHGRLKDVDWIDNTCEDHRSDKDGSWCYAWKDIDNAPTIIEADKESGGEE